ncbi:MAG: hypothetical protein LR015_01030 [Verrucomicrobia bacterium]|nr:hypothetical protein [Verrucomicrobiota bacterium]
MSQQFKRWFDGNGNIIQTVVSGENTDMTVADFWTDAQLAGKRWQQRVINPLGQTIVERSPVWQNPTQSTDVVIANTQYYYGTTGLSNGRLLRKSVPGAADYLFEYDSMGFVIREGYDGDNSGQLVVYNNTLDMVLESSLQHIQDTSGAAWAILQRSTFDNDGVRIILEHSEQQIDGLSLMGGSVRAHRRVAMVPFSAQVASQNKAFLVETISSVNSYTSLVQESLVYNSTTTAIGSRTMQGGLLTEMLGAQAAVDNQPSTVFSYDAAGRRISVVDTLGVTQFFYLLPRHYASKGDTWPRCVR